MKWLLNFFSGLNLSRAIGDHAYKTNKTLPLSEQMISPLPDIKKLTIDPVKDSFIFLACDGIWNSLSSQETVDFINERLDKKDVKIDNDYLTNIIKELFDHCLAPDTMGDGTGCDNMTAVIAKIKPNAFSNHKEAEQSEKTKVELETVNEGKRPAENEQDKIPEPQAKKAKIDNDSTEAATETKPEVEDEKTETKPEVVASAPWKPEVEFKLTKNAFILYRVEPNEIKKERKKQTKWEKIRASLKK